MIKKTLTFYIENSLPFTTILFFPTNKKKNIIFQWIYYIYISEFKKKYIILVIEKILKLYNFVMY